MVVPIVCHETGQRLSKGSDTVVLQRVDRFAENAFGVAYRTNLLDRVPADSTRETDLVPPLSKPSSASPTERRLDRPDTILTPAAEPSA